MKTNEERLQDLFAYLDRQTHVQPEEIPNIDLYMDPDGMKTTRSLPRP